MYFSKGEEPISSKGKRAHTKSATKFLVRNLVTKQFATHIFYDFIPLVMIALYRATVMSRDHNTYNSELSKSFISHLYDVKFCTDDMWPWSEFLRWWLTTSCTTKISYPQIILFYILYSFMVAQGHQMSLGGFIFDLWPTDSLTNVFLVEFQS